MLPSPSLYPSQFIPLELEITGREFGSIFRLHKAAVKLKSQIPVIWRKAEEAALFFSYTIGEARMDGLTWNMECHQGGSMSFLVLTCGRYHTLTQADMVTLLFSWGGRYYDPSARDSQET